MFFDIRQVDIGNSSFENKIFIKIYNIHFYILCILYRIKFQLTFNIIYVFISQDTETISDIIAKCLYLRKFDGIRRK